MSISINNRPLPSSAPISMNGSRVKKIYLNGVLVHSAERAVPLSVAVQQAPAPQWAEAYADCLVDDHSTAALSAFVPAQSYGICLSYVSVERGGSTVFTMLETSCTYTGAIIDRHDITTNYTYAGLLPGDVIRLKIRAQYNPDVSGAHTSPASVLVTLA